MRELYFLVVITVFLIIVSLASRAAGYFFQRFHLWTTMNKKSYLSESRRYEGVHRLAYVACIIGAIAVPLLGNNTMGDNIAFLLSCAGLISLIIISKQSHIHGAICALAERKAKVDQIDLDWINKHTRRWRWIHRIHDLYSRRSHTEAMDQIRQDAADISPQSDTP